MRGGEGASLAGWDCFSRGNAFYIHFGIGLLG